MALEPLIKSVLLFALSLYLGDILVTGRITAYIHPRFIGFTWFAVLGFGVIGLAMLVRALRAQDRPMRPLLYVAVLVPLLMGFAIPPATFGSELVARQGINLVARQRSRVGTAAQKPPEATPAVPQQPASAAAPPVTSSQQPAPSVTTEQPAVTQAPPASQIPASAAPAPASPSPAAPSPAAPPAGAPVASVVLTDQNMFSMLNTIYEKPHEYAGATVEMTGFVYKLEDLAADEFTLVRLIVTCHVAHAVPDGFISIHPDAAGLAVDSWYQVRGVLELGQYQGKETLKLRVTELVPLDQPKDPYIYP